MTDIVGIQARIAWELLISGDGCLHDSEPEADYNGLLEGMEAAQLLSLMEKVLERLKQLGAEPVERGRGGEVRKECVEGERDGEGGRPNGATAGREPETLYIDSSYHIRLGSPDGPAIPFRPLVRALFILFLRHPEGIVLKQRGRYEAELNEIYAIISPKTAPEDRQARIHRLVDPEDNSFSEKASVLNALLDRLLSETAFNYKIQGINGYPRRIPLSPLKVVWDISFP